MAELSKGERRSKLAQLFFGVPIIGSIIALLGIFLYQMNIPKEEIEARKQAQQEQIIRDREEEIRQGAKRFEESVLYFRDTRTGICFASRWEGGVHGGPGLATVSCEVIPQSLLFTKDFKAQ